MAGTTGKKWGAGAGWFMVCILGVFVLRLRYFLHTAIIFGATSHTGQDKNVYGKQENEHLHCCKYNIEYFKTDPLAAPGLKEPF